MVNVEIPLYHNVCPLYTYLKGDHCYSEPINKGRLVAFPQWNESSSELDFIFTLKQGSFIDEDIIDDLQVQWFADDEGMQQLLHYEAEDLPEYVKVVSSASLRNQD
jgi:hypothetical protein